MEGQIILERCRSALGCHRAVEFTLTVVSYAYDVSVDEMRAATRRCPEVAFARQIAMYLTHVVYRLSLTEVAAAFGRDRTTASHACHVIEDLRDSTPFDRHLARLERILSEGAYIDSDRVEARP